MPNLSLWTRKFPRLNAILLALVVLAIFFIPSLPHNLSKYLYPPTFTAIFMVAAFSFREKRKPVVIFAFILTVFLWIATLSNLDVLKTIFRCLQIGFFIFLVTGLIKEISSQPSVTTTVIVDAITGYLLLGFAFSLFVMVVVFINPGALQMASSASPSDVGRLNESIYYTFITFSTTGYGDTLPKHPITKSLAILIGISGQLYIAIIIAMLVGKYSSMKN